MTDLPPGAASSAPTAIPPAAGAASSAATTPATDAASSAPTAVANPQSAIRNPQSLGALLVRAARLYGAHTATFLLPVVALELPLLLLTVGVLALLDPGPAALTPEWLLRFTVFTLVHSALTLVEAVLAFVLLAVIAVQVRALGQGETLTLRGALRAVLPRLGALLGGSALLIVTVGLLTVVGVVLSVVFSLVLTVINSDPNSGGLMGALQRGLGDPTQNLLPRLVLLLLVSALVIFLVVKWSLMVQVVMLEDAPPVHALRRSWALVRGQFRRTLTMLLLGSLPISLLSNGDLAAEFFSLVPTGDGRVGTLAGARLISLGLRLLILPWTLTLLTLFYYDLRLRHERAPGAAH
ncbi:MAG: hypothetical protein M3Z04_23555 [Chloroflexota bacterium]|nr:hypothetical protein [Chloroflexota bacterium]